MSYLGQDFPLDSKGQILFRGAASSPKSARQETGAQLMARPRAVNYAEKRRNILLEAARLFSHHGYAGTSTSMIAQGCGVSKALLYHYYPDKETILFDLLHTHIVELIDAVEAANVNCKDGDDILFAISSALINAYLDADDTHHVQISSLSLLPSAKQEILREMERKLVSIFAEGVARTLPQIGRSPLLKPMTMSLFGMLNWHYLWFRDGKPLTRDDYARLATALITFGGPHAFEVLSKEGGVSASGRKEKRTANRLASVKKGRASADL
jgi:AcrR family transcriptional regulator